MKRTLKTILLIVIAVTLLAFSFACSGLEKVKSIAFVSSPDAQYEMGESVNASNFKILVTLDDNSSKQMDITSASVVVTGLINGKLDTTTPGTKTVTVTYRGVSASFEYEVLDIITNIEFASQTSVKVFSTKNNLAFTWNGVTAAATNNGSFYTLSGLTFNGITGEATEAAITNQLGVLGVVAPYEVKTPWLYNAAAVDVSGNVTISNNRELAGFAKALTESYTGTVTLSADIDLLGAEWKPILNFAGIFDGGYVVGSETLSRSISNLTIENLDPANDGGGHATCRENAGLFGKVSGTASFINLNIDNVYINMVSLNDSLPEDGKNFAALIGMTASAVSVTNINISNAIINGNGRIGSIIGNATNGAATIENCNISDIEYSAYNQFFSNDSDGEGDKVGGLVGQAQINCNYINNTVEKATLIATRDVGGLVGYQTAKPTTTNFESNIVTDSYLRATAVGGYVQKKGSCNVGGLIGTAQGTGTITFSSINKNTITSSVELIANSANDNSSGLVIGGIRRGTNDVTIKYGITEVYTGWTDSLSLKFYTIDELAVNFNLTGLPSELDVYYTNIQRKLDPNSHLVAVKAAPSVPFSIFIELQNLVIAEITAGVEIYTTI